MEKLGLNEKEKEYTLKKIFNKIIIITYSKFYEGHHVAYNNNTYGENDNGFWFKRKHDKNGNVLYYENSDRYWFKREYDKNNKIIYYENSNGEIINKRK